MAFVLADRVLETASAPGTGSVSLLGATPGYQSFFSGIGNANTCYYTIADQSAGKWEVGIGTYSSSGNLLSRDTVISSSNSGALVNFNVDIQNVFVTYPSERSVFQSLDLTAAAPQIFASSGFLVYSTIVSNSFTMGANSISEVRGPITVLPGGGVNVPAGSYWYVN